MRLSLESYRLLVAALLGALLWGAGIGSTVRADDPSLQQSFEVIDSLRHAQAFREALDRLSDMSQEHSGSLEVQWRYAILWSDYGFSLDHEHRARSAYWHGLLWADRALETDSSSAWAHLAKAVASGRAALLAESHRKSIRLSRQVKAHVDRAIALDSTLAPAYHVRGAWHSAVADLGFFKRVIVRAVYGGLPGASFEEAIADLQRAIQLESRTAHHLELGKAYLKMGQTDDARKQLRIALDVPPADPFAQKAKTEARELLGTLG